jgi:hypothetical protein
MKFLDNFMLQDLLDSDAFLGIEDKHASQQVHVWLWEVFEEGSGV